MFGLTPFNRNEVAKRNGDDYLDLFNLMDDFFNDSFPSNRFLRNDTFKIDVKDQDNEYVVEAELPGFKKEEINVEVNDDHLSISALRKEEADDSKGRYIHRERKSTAVKRSLYLKDIHAEDIKAKFEDGLLTINLPKVTSEPEGRTIDIE